MSSKTKRILNVSAVSLFVATLLTTALYVATSLDILLTLAITLGTFFYHFAIRLSLSFAFNNLIAKSYNPQSRWFRVSEKEHSLYVKLNVKNWKRKMPTYNPSEFDPRLHSWVEIAQATCKSEVIHEVISLLSLLPILAGVWVGAFPVFIITSLIMALFDLAFVAIQRYNRPRIERLIHPRNFDNLLPASFNFKEELERGRQADYETLA